MNGVEAIRMHIVWEATRAPNARDKDNFLPWYTQLGHHLLGLCQDGVITTPWAPAHFLICDKIFTCQCGRSTICRSIRLLTHNLPPQARSSSHFATISDTLKGKPCTFERPTASTR